MTNSHKRRLLRDAGWVDDGDGAWSPPVDDDDMAVATLTFDEAWQRYRLAAIKKRHKERQAGVDCDAGD